MILATTLVEVNALVGWLAYRSKRLEALIEGRPVVIVHDGKIDERSMRKCQLTRHELEAALRAAGCAGPGDVRFAVLENTGRISVIPLTHSSGATDPN